MLLSLLTSVLLLGYKLRDTTRLGAVWNKRQDMEKQRAKLARQEAVFAAEMADALLKPPVTDVVHTAHAPIGSSRKHVDLLFDPEADRRRSPPAVLDMPTLPNHLPSPARGAHMDEMLMHLSQQLALSRYNDHVSKTS